MVWIYGMDVDGGCTGEVYIRQVELVDETEHFYR
jgi:hypothetical protein